MNESGKGSLIKDDDMVHATTQLWTIAATDIRMVPRTEKTSGSEFMHNFYCTHTRIYRKE